MNFEIIFPYALSFIFFLTTIFLSKEMWKKFGFMKKFVKSSNQIIKLNYKGAQKEGIDKDMHNVVIYWHKSFSVLVGFNLQIPILGNGFDYYGYVEAKKIDRQWIAVFSTYLGNGPVDFQFLINQEIKKHEPNPEIKFGHKVQGHKPTAIFPPHFYQKRLHFYG